MSTKIIVGSYISGSSSKDPDINHTETKDPNVRAISEIIYSACDLNIWNPFKEGKYSELDYDHILIEGPNPYWNKTNSGYILEMGYGTPTRIHTPEGQYQCFHRSLCPPRGFFEDLIKSNFNGHLVLKELAPERHTTGPTGGMYGPWYAVVSINGVNAPECLSPQFHNTPGDKRTSDAKGNDMVILLELMLEEQRLKQKDKDI